MTRIQKWCHCLALSALTGICQAAVPIAGAAHYTQNFDSLFVPQTGGNVAAVSGWTDNSTVPGWWFYYAGNAANAGTFGGSDFAYFGADGTAALATVNLTLNSMGTAGNPDRAFATPPNTARGEQSGILVFQNSSGQLLELNRIRYNAETRRSNTATAAIESIFVWYRKAATEAAALTMTTGPVSTTIFGGLVATTPTSYYITGWTELAEARFAHSNGVPNTPLNDSSAVNAALSSPIRLNPGEFLAVRFSNINDAGTDGLFGIDDLDMAFVAGGAGIAAAVSNIVRDDNTTPRNPADDRVNFTLTVTGTGPIGTTWAINAPPIFASSGQYGVPKAFAGIPISTFSAPGHSATFTVQDAANSAMSTTATVTVPWCSLTASATGFVYRDGGTPLNSSDDNVDVIALADGPFTGPDYTVSASGFFVTPFTYGAPATIPNLGPGTLFDLAFIDNADSLCTTTVRLIPPAFIGINATSGSQRPLLTILDTSGENINGTSAAWLYDTALRTLTMNSGGATVRTVRSETVDLSAVSGAVKFTMELAARDTSSGFETGDIFNAELILTGPGGSTVNLVPSAKLGSLFSDTNGDGTLAGSEIATLGSAVVHTFSYLVPDDITSAQLVIRGITDSTSEFMTMQDVRFEPAGATLQAIAGTALRDNKVTGDPSDDTFTVPITITMSSPGLSTGWISDSTPAAGDYATPTHVFGPYSAAASVTVTIRDSILGAAAEAVINLVPPLAPGVMGLNSTVNPPVAVFIETAAVQWVNDPLSMTLTMNDGGVVDRVATSQSVDLGGISGAVQFTAELLASDTSIGSNFESTDSFLAELILDEGLPGGQTVNLITPFDTGTLNPPGTIGRLTGFTGGEGGGGLDYNSNRFEDEFNTGGVPAEDFLQSTLTLSHLIPDNVVSARLRITGHCGATNSTETFVVRVVNFSVPEIQIHAPPQIFTRSAGMSLKIRIADILAACDAPPGTNLILTGIGPSAQGAVILQTSTHVLYFAANDTSDSFSYTVSGGGTSLAGNTITIMTSPQEGLLLDGTVLPGGGYSGNFAGIPGFTYQILQSSDLSSWTLLQTITAPGNGLFSFTDPVVRPRSYYRLFFQP